MVHNVVKCNFKKKTCFTFVCMCPGCGGKCILTVSHSQKGPRTIDTNPQMALLMCVLTSHI